jgi:hypothetical protein
LGLLFVGRWSHTGVRARGEKVAGDLGGEVEPGKKEERREEGR